MTFGWRRARGRALQLKSPRRPKLRTFGTFNRPPSVVGGSINRSIDSSLRPESSLGCGCSWRSGYWLGNGSGLRLINRSLCLPVEPHSLRHNFILLSQRSSGMVLLKIWTIMGPETGKWCSARKGLDTGPPDQNAPGDQTWRFSVP